MPPDETQVAPFLQGDKEQGGTAAIKDNVNIGWKRRITNNHAFIIHKQWIILFITANIQLIIIKWNILFHSILLFEEINEVKLTKMISWLRRNKPVWHLSPKYLLEHWHLKLVLSKRVQIPPLRHGVAAQGSGTTARKKSNSFVSYIFSFIVAWSLKWRI